MNLPSLVDNGDPKIKVDDYGDIVENPYLPELMVDSFLVAKSGRSCFIDFTFKNLTFRRQADLRITTTRFKKS